MIFPEKRTCTPFRSSFSATLCCVKHAVIIGLMLLAAQAEAKEIALVAKREYNACLKETAQARAECSYGGCGNILASCYERQIDVFEHDSEKRVDHLTALNCKEQAHVVSDRFNKLGEELVKLREFEHTWSGYELRVETAHLKKCRTSAAYARVHT